MRTRTFLALQALSLLLAAPAHASTIRGTVRDTNGSPGRPVAGASVLVWQQGGAWSRTVLSGPDGYWESQAPDAVYNVCCNKSDQPGFRTDLGTQEAVNVILAGQDKVVNFDLPARTPYEAQLLWTSAPSALAPNQVASVQLHYRNQGTFGWDANTRLAVSNSRFAEPGRDGSTPLQGPGWLSTNRVASLGAVAPGAETTVTFSVRGPAQPGSTTVYLELVEDGVTWFEGHGDDVTLSITVASTASLVGLDAQGASHAAVIAAWNADGGASVVGIPADNGGGERVHAWGQGLIQDFRGGTAGAGALLYRAGEPRAHWVHGGAWSAYLAAGGAEGPLGLPTGDAASGKQTFEHGTLEQQANGTWAVKGVFVPPPALGRVGIDGNQIFAADGSQTIDVGTVADSGARVVRINFISGPWSGPGDATVHAGRTWSQAADQVVNGLRAKGVQVYGLLNDELVGGSGDFLRDQGDPATAKAWIEKFAEACVTVVGQMKDRVNVFEVINEPNDWAGQTRPRVSAYWHALILKRVYERVKLDHAGDASWQVTLLSGPILSLSTTNGDDFLAQLYKDGRAYHDWDGVRGRAGRFPLDGIGYHIYDAFRPSEVASVFKRHVDAIDAVIRAEDPEAAAKKIWISEFGWQSGDVGATGQSNMMQAGIDALLADGRVACGIYFCTFDWTGSTYGIVDVNKNRKPSFDTFRANAGR